MDMFSGHVSNWPEISVNYRKMSNVSVTGIVSPVYINNKQIYCECLRLI